MLIWIAMALSLVGSPEERRLSLKHRWTGERFDAVYRVGPAYLPEAMTRLNTLLRDYRCRKTITMAPPLIDLLWQLTRDLRPTGPVSIVSGYRSEGSNASLLAAGRVVDPNSQHMYGRAMDVVFPGVPLTALRDAALRHGIGGVGHYPFSGPAFVHLDVGPVRHWEELAPEVKRALPVHRPAGRLRLDCEATIAGVLQRMPLAQALAGLPSEASVGIPAEWLPQPGTEPPLLATGPKSLVRRVSRMRRATRSRRGVRRVARLRRAARGKRRR